MFTDLGISSLGKYAIFLYRSFTNREKMSVYWRLFVEECMIVGIDSVLIVVLSSSFIGAVTAVQSTYNLVSPLIPLYIIGTVVRDMTVIELAPTVTALIFAGKVGSNIAGHLGTMRITEQIDALEVMGINATSYLVLPKVVASVAMYPLLVCIAGFLSILGGYAAGTFLDLYTPEEYIFGIRSQFKEFNVYFALIKAVTFAFLISSISAYKGFYANGGALEVGIASTQAVTNSCIALLVADYALAQLFLG